ncbi:MAG: hypothetical protein U0Y82_11625 [Thermoleophilia bacterium]
MPRSPRARNRLIATLAALAAAATLAGSAQATDYAEEIDQDSVPTIGNSSFQFRSGWVDWFFGSGWYSANVTGTLTLDDADGSCARMRLETFHDGVSMATGYGGSVCPSDGRKHDYNVDLWAPDDPDIDLMKVSVQKQTNGKDWSIVESAYVDPGFHSDGVSLSADGVDFGDGRFFLGTTMGYGTVSFARSDGGYLTPRLTGTLWLNNVSGVCARMTMTFRTQSGTFLATKEGGRVCAPDNDLHAFGIDLAPYTSRNIHWVDIGVQTQGSNGSWNDVEGKLFDPVSASVAGL